MEGRVDYVLNVRLPCVDDRVCDRGPSESRGVGGRGSGVGSRLPIHRSRLTFPYSRLPTPDSRFRSAPGPMAVRIGMERLVAEVFAQQAELPQVISDVLAHVRDRAVRAHDDLDVLAFVLCGE